VLRLILVGLFLLLLVRKGFAATPSYLAWPMFSRLASCEFDCSYRAPDGSLRRFNPWTYLPNLETGMTERGLASFLEYLRTVHGIELDGRVILRDERGTTELALEGSHVAPR
jgi:hypothetical protein